MSSSPTILVFDSGLGGLTVFREICAVRRDARFVYAADDEAFPYGHLSEADLSTRVTGVMSSLIESHRPDIVVVACNTASTLVLAELRARFTVPFVGTVPAIKPACAASGSKLVSVLGTEATVSREYTKALIRDFSQGCAITLVGAGQLAILAEGYLRGETVPDDSIRAEIAPCFIEKDGQRTDTIVLACTHYPLLLERLRALSPWPVAWLDPAPAIARRITDLIGVRPAGSPDGGASFLFTSGRQPSGDLVTALRLLGFEDRIPV